MKAFIPSSLATAALALFLVQSPAHAHCDTLDGPVVAAARAALAAGDVTPVLKWVSPPDEAAIRAAFGRTLVVRRQSKPAAELADTWFFETLVRIHRAAEGAPYTGLKSDAPSEPGIAAADRALESGQGNELAAQIIEPLRARLQAKLARVRELHAGAAKSVGAGRDFVAAYVDYVHFAEKLATLSTEAAAPAHAEHQH